MNNYESQGGTLKPQNYYRFGRLHEVVIEDVKLVDPFPALFIFEGAERVVFKNCYFPYGIIICGFYEELILVDSVITILTSDVNARKIEISSKEKTSSPSIIFDDCKLKFLTDFSVKNANVTIKTINEVHVKHLAELENATLNVLCCEFHCLKLLLRGENLFVMDDQNLCYDYYPLSKIEPRIRPGLTFNTLQCDDGAKATFKTSWNEKFNLNGKEVDPKNTSIPQCIEGLEDVYLSKGPDDEPGEAFCY